MIVAAAGLAYATFGDAIARLRDALAVSTPRTCSFAMASTGNHTSVGDAALAYRRLVARVDHALFACKDDVRGRDREPAGDLVDAGTVDILAEPAASATE